MRALSEELAAVISETPVVVLDDSDTQDRERFRDRSELSIKNIQAELALLSLRQRELRKRIQHLRHALVELVHVFGPEILADARRGSEGKSRDLSRGATTILDLCRQVLSRSDQWLTLRELEGGIRDEFPAALSRFINPGVSVANALRTLRRHGQVELSANEGSARWRWTGPRKP